MKHSTRTKKSSTQTFYETYTATCENILQQTQLQENNCLLQWCLKQLIATAQTPCGLSTQIRCQTYSFFTVIIWNLSCCITDNPLSSKALQQLCKTTAALAYFHNSQQYARDSTTAMKLKIQWLCHGLEVILTNNHNLWHMEQPPQDEDSRTRYSETLVLRGRQQLLSVLKNLPDNTRRLMRAMLESQFALSPKGTPITMEQTQPYRWKKLSIDSQLGSPTMWIILNNADNACININNKVRFNTDIAECFNLEDTLHKRINDKEITIRFNDHMSDGEDMHASIVNRIDSRFLTEEEKVDQEEWNKLTDALSSTED